MTTTSHAAIMVLLYDDDEPRCPTCDEPEMLLASGSVGHCGDEYGNPCDGWARKPEYLSERDELFRLGGDPDTAGSDAALIDGRDCWLAAAALSFYERGVSRAHVGFALTTAEERYFTNWV